MSDQTHTPLADQTISRLRSLAKGNGLAPEKIELIEAQEKIYTLEGTLQLVPFCEKQLSGSTVPVKDMPRKLLGNFNELKAEIEARQKAFLESNDWLPAIRAELKETPGEGWGLNGAKIVLPQRSITLTASETCPACQGQLMLTCPQCQAQGFVVCTQCQGRGQELCYNCGGRGENPAQPGQPCVVCHGSRYAPCRFCRSTGKLVCPTCQGRRGTPCTTCHGRGQILQEVALVCGATTQFRIGGEGLPTGLRRGLQRLGVANLTKDHADITSIAPATDENAESENRPSSAVKHELHYQAQLPYADMRIRFGGNRVTLISSLGKRGLLMGVPPFLDAALKPQRAVLAKAARGAVPLGDALAMRVVRDALKLELGGRGSPNELRRLYSIGLSPAVMQEIILNMRRALTRFTRHVRIPVATVADIIGISAMAAWFLSSEHIIVTNNWPTSAILAFDLAILGLVMVLAWVVLSKSMQIILRRQFPDLKISLRRNIGPIGHAMLDALAVGWLILLMLAPDRPLWMTNILHLLHR